MKRIELLLQGKKVENITGTGYYEISEGKLYVCVNDKKVETDVMNTKFLLEEGEEFIPKKKAYFYKKDGCLLRIREKSIEKDMLKCGDVWTCFEHVCVACPFYRGKELTVNKDDMIVIEY